MRAYLALVNTGILLGFSLSVLTGTIQFMAAVWYQNAETIFEDMLLSLLHKK